MQLMQRERYVDQDNPKWFPRTDDKASTGSTQRSHLG
jgi:hypothetical protein